MRLFHASDIEFIHLHYRSHHPVRFFEVGSLISLFSTVGTMPGDAIFMREPATAVFLTSG